MINAESVKQKLEGLISQANATTGNSDTNLTTAVSALCAGFGSGAGGNANIYSGDYVVEQETTVPTAGLTLNLGLTSRAKWFFMWFDRTDFLSLEAVYNNSIGIIVMFPVTVSEIIPIRYNASTVIPDTADRFFLLGTYYNTTTGSDNGYGLNGISNHVNNNMSVWAANDDGTITISRFSSAAINLLVGTYHWMAVC